MPVLNLTAPCPVPVNAAGPVAVPARRTARALVLLLVLAAVALLGVTPASAVGDDYPYRADTTGAADQWGFTQRQCVSFVAWRMEQRNHPLDNSGQGWGSALSWDEAARALGYGIGTRPVAGSIAHWNAGERSAVYPAGSTRANAWMAAGSHGHVGYVRQVHTDGTASVEHYNADGGRRYTVSRMRAPRYLYVSVPTPR